MARNQFLEALEAVVDCWLGERYENEHAIAIGTIPRRLSVRNVNKTGRLTNVNKSSRRAFAELFRFVRQRHFDHSRDVSRRRLNTDGMTGDQLETETKRKMPSILMSKSNEDYITRDRKSVV